MEDFCGPTGEYRSTHPAGSRSYRQGWLWGKFVQPSFAGYRQLGAESSRRSTSVKRLDPKEPFLAMPPVIETHVHGFRATESFSMIT
jgi:hypothetical protein